LPEQEPSKSSIPQTAFIQRNPANSSKVTKKREKYKRKARFSFYFRVLGKFGKARVTKKREKYKRKARFSFYFRVLGKFGEAKVTKKLGAA